MSGSRKFVLTFIAACLYYSGLVRLARWWTQRSGPHLVILNYHRAAGGDLRRHLHYLQQHYHILHLEAALEALYIPPKKGYERRSQDRRTSLAVTFDDGYYDNYTHGFALAREMQIPITIFLIPGYIQSGEFFWWKEGVRLVRSAQVNTVTIEGRSFFLKRVNERKDLALAIDTRLRYATSVSEREAFLVSMRELLGAPSVLLPDEELARPLNWEEVRLMEESEWVSFGAHTMYHPILTYLADPNELQREVEECRTQLELRLEHPIRIFAYPVGQQQHLNEAVISMLKQAGYDWACTTLYGFNTIKRNPYLLRRIEVDVSQHWLVVAAEAAGLWDFFARLRWNPMVRKYIINRLRS